MEFYGFHSKGYGKVLDSMKRQNERHKKGEAEALPSQTHRELGKLNDSGIML